MSFYLCGIIPQDMIGGKCFLPMSHVLSSNRSSSDLSPSTKAITEIWMLVKFFSLIKIVMKTLVTKPQPLIQNQDFSELS